MRISWLDLKLGLRMLVRYPGLSIAGGLALALVIVCGVAAGIFHAVVYSTLPFEDGHRVVVVENWDASRNEPAPHDFPAWREGLTTVGDLGAFRLITRNLAGPGQPAEPVRVAEISASAFTIARVPPLMGRHLLPEDEQDGAHAVLVIREDEWRRRFDGDSAVIGRTVQVGDAQATLVGVMPRAFGFPVNERYWMPLPRARLARAQAGEGAPSSMPFKFMPQDVIHVFGRLAAHADVPAAQAELTLLGQRAAADAPQTHGQLRPRVLPYTRWFFDEWHDGEIFLNQALLLLLLGIVGANVAVLVYARTATRRVEIAVRSALGASRARIAGQMFAEGLALTGVAALAGFVVASIARGELEAYVPWQLVPFWVNAGSASAAVAAYVLALAVAGAIIVGVIPALQATGRRAQASLQQAASATSRWKVGRTYSALIVVQVTLAVAILPYAVSSSWTSAREALAGPGFPADRYLTARLETDDTARPGAAAELARRIESEPGVSAVALLPGIPGGEPRDWIEVDGIEGWREVGIGRMAPDTAPFFGIRVVAGRGFDERDADPVSRQVVVNRTFASEILGEQAVGARVRGLEPRQSPEADREPGPWLEVIGVVEDFPPRAGAASVAHARLYHPQPRVSDSGLLAIRLGDGGQAELAARLREVSTAVDRGLLLREVRTLDAVLRDRQAPARVAAVASAAATVTLLLLSATGLYALMAFTVAQRRREIGIRIALGASPAGIVRGILSRAFWQLGAGIGIGVLIVGIWDAETGGELTGGAGLAVLPVVAAFVLLIGLVAAAAPAARALRIEPTEALKEG